ncbi:hypothetical protein [Fusobacterium ulcerans]|uniref:hypothetical protein n=1 Tax=Fusobacterium ulcerans TaxID=861 RepID=UPI0027B911B0|nr:hypothetical protein [Fusobacterium ulcerans]
METAIRKDLISFWYKYLSDRTSYPCFLDTVELSDEDIKGYGGYPIIKFNIIEVDSTSEGILPTSKDIGEIEEIYNFQARYMLEFNVYSRGNKPANVDKLLYELSNSNIFSRYANSIDKTDLTFKDLVLRDKMNIINVNEFLQDQPVTRYRYQQNFLAEVRKQYIVPKAKIETIEEVKE